MVLDFYANLPPEKQGKLTKLVKKWFTDAHSWFVASSRLPSVLRQRQRCCLGNCLCWQG